MSNFLPAAKVLGVGDTPDLISDETPPAVMLELSSHSDLQAGASSIPDLSLEGESESSIEMREKEELIISPFEVNIKQRHNNLGDLTRAVPHHTRANYKTSDEDDDETANVINNNGSLTFSKLGRADTIPESPEEEIDEKEWRKQQQPMQSSNFSPSGRAVSGAVNAPEEEEQEVPSDDDDDDDVEDDSRVDPAAQKTVKSFVRPVSPGAPPPPLTTGLEASPSYTVLGKEIPTASSQPQPNKTRNNNDNHEGDDATSELVSKQQKQNNSQSNSIPSKSIESEAGGLEEKDLFAVKKAFFEQGRQRKASRSTSRRKQSRGGYGGCKTRENSKSPGRDVVVLDRKGPIKLKSSDGKPLSPYLCKVFPVKENYEKPGHSFHVDQHQNRLLDDELSRSLERERLMLLEAMSEYFNSKGIPLSSPPNRSPNPRSSIGGDGPTATGPGQVNEADPPTPIIIKESYMSWVIKESRRESQSELDTDWNPLSNIFRRSRSTQVSYKTSTADNRPEEPKPTRANNHSQTQSKLASSSARKIVLVGQEGEEDSIQTSAQNMFQSLKTVQKAIHISDLFCFRNAALPETPLGDSLSQPQFQQFMESASEIEILVNVMSILGTAKENVQNYLSSIQEANLITGQDSGLTKIEIENNKLKDSNCILENAKDNYGNAASTTTCSSMQSMPEKNENKSIPVCCPSCQSSLTLRLNQSTSPDRLLPRVHTFLEEQRNVALASYVKKDQSKSRLIHLVMCNGHKYQIQFASASSSNSAVQGILTAKMEYVGEPTHFNLESLLGTIHRCISYMDTRLSCSCVWIRQSKRFMLELIEKYLQKGYKPSSDLSWWGLRRMEGKLRQFNTFAGIIRAFSDELIEAVSKFHFCMQKSLALLNKKLKDPKLPGFLEGPGQARSGSGSCSNVEERRSRLDRFEEMHSTYRPNPEVNDNGVASSVKFLFKKLKNKVESIEDTTLSDTDASSVEAIFKIISFAVQEVETTSALGLSYVSQLKMPNRRSRRVLRFMNTTSSQLGISKDVEFGALFAAFLSAVDKMSLFEEFMCEQKVEIRAKVNLICLQMVQKLADLRSLLGMQRNWSVNLAKNTFMRIKEINEIRRLRTLKKKNKHIAEKMELLRGSDGSLREVISIM